MKRGGCLFLVALILCLSVLTNVGSIAVFAADPASDTELTFSDDTVDFSCRLDVETHKIYLNGLIRHDVFVMHSDYTVAVYAIAPGLDPEEIIRDPKTSPVAGSAIAIKFEFVLDVTSVTEQYSRYCVVLCSPDGKQMVSSEPKFAEVTSDFSYDPNDRSRYKGMATSQVSAAVGAGAGRVIIPVQLERLLGKTSNGYVYQMDTGNLYFDKAYIESLDVKVRSATASGAEVYLQYLRTVDGVKEIPRVYDTEILNAVEGLTSFLCERYENRQEGQIHGIIVGETVDLLAKDAYARESISLSAYAEKYALYVVSIANAARRIQSNMDIVLPFSAVNTYGGSMSDEYAPSLVLEAVLSVLEKGFSAPFLCTTMIESHTDPLQYPDGWDTYDAKLLPMEDHTTLHAGNIADYAQYLKNLKAQFSCAPTSFMFVWTASDALRGNALTTAYAYSYFRLIAESSLSSFVVSFSDSETSGNTRGFGELKHLYTYIDTAEGFSVAEPLLKYFDIESWAELHTSPYNGPYTLRTHYRTVPLLSAPQNAKGSFSYFDFSTSANLNTWFVGNACRGIRFNYHKSGGKALQIELQTVENEYAEALCLYEYPENFVYTPYVAFRVEVEASERAVSGALYEIVLTSGTGRTSIVASSAVTAGESTTLVLDLSEYVGAHMSDYWKIGVRPLGEQDGTYSLWVYDIVGFSTEYTSEELGDLIETERLRIRNLGNSDDGNDKDRVRPWMYVAVAVVIVMIGIVVFLLLRPTDENAHKESSDETRDKQDE